MKHQKRQTVPKNWPIPRKGTTFVIKNNSKGIPILVVLRDMMNLAQNRKEVKQAIHKKDLMINNKLVNDEKKSLELFDILTIIPEKKSYKLILSNKGKYALEEVSEKETKNKISKVIGKKILSGRKTQLNLSDGKNYLSDLKCNLNDSVSVNFEKNKIEKCLALKEKAEVLVIGGKHAGATGTIQKIISEMKMAQIKTAEKTYNVLIKQLMVTK